MQLHCCHDARFLTNRQQDWDHQSTVLLVQVPITYVTEMSWVNELMKLAPTILLIAGYVWFTRKAMGGLGGMGGPGGSRGGMGGIFSVGKAPVRSFCRSLQFCSCKAGVCQKATVC